MHLRCLMVALTACWRYLQGLYDHQPRPWPPTDNRLKEKTQEATEDLSRRIKEQADWTRSMLEEIKASLEDDIQREVATGVR